MIVAIRDDDVSFFTDPDRLDRVWAGLDVHVTYAATPFMVESVERHIPGREFGRSETGRVEHPLRDNPAIIDYVRAQVRDGRASVALHGCNHRYRVEEDHLVAEFGDGSFEDLYAAADRGRREVEALLGTTVDVFVPPDNSICRAGMQAIAAAGLRYVQRAFPLRKVDTPIKPAWMTHYARRVWHRALHGTVYSQPYDNGYVVEAPAYLFKRSIPLDTMKRDFDHFYRLGLPFTIATHHWELEEPATRDKMHRLLEHIFRRRDVRFAPLREVFE